MSAINIQSLFADIIDTPEQRQKKMLQQGMLQGQQLTKNLTGLARAAAPLAQMAGQLGVQRNEDLRRAVQPMLGIDPRTAGEKLGEQIQGMDMSTPDGMLKAAQAIQSIDPVRAASLRQAAANKRLELQTAERELRRQQISDTQAANREARAAAGEQRAVLGERRQVADWATDFVNEAIDRRTEAEETTRNKNLRTSVAKIAERSDPELAESIRNSDLPSSGLLDLQMKLTKEPDLKVRTQSIIGSDLIEQGIDVPDPNSTYNVFVRTTEGENPVTNPSDRVGAIISDSAVYRTPIDRPRNMNDETSQQLKTIISSDPRFGLFDDDPDTLVNEIFEYQEANPNAGRQGAVDAIVDKKLSSSYNNPIRIEVNRDFLKNPQRFIKNLPNNFFDVTGVSRNDNIDVRFLTNQNIKEQNLDPEKYKAGNAIITYPIRNNKGLIIENGVPRTKTTIIR
ncbi:hypothetical protein N9K75_00385 [bacterium]|nr:hypothetical protein [bacterium]MDB4352254.1 hypothetical protein [Porticoccaceae bacterium]